MGPVVHFNYHDVIAGFISAFEFHELASRLSQQPGKWGQNTVFANINNNCDLTPTIAPKVKRRLCRSTHHGDPDDKGISQSNLTDWLFLTPTYLAFD